MPLSGKYWPVHIKPYEDELLSSWLVRLARAHEMKTHTFCDIEWPHHQIWTRDVDRCFADKIIDDLVRLTGTCKERVFQTTLTSFEGNLTEKINSKGIAKWVLILGRYHRRYTSPGLQFCPICLAEDDSPYFRRSWRLALSTVCTKHHVILKDICPSCSSPIMFHRVKLESSRIDFCSECGFLLSKDKANKCTQHMVNTQKYIFKRLKTGWLHIPKFGPAPSLHYFNFLYRVLNMLSRGKKLNVILNALRELKAPGDLNILSEIKGHQLESLRISERYQLIMVANWIFQKWSYRFVNVCQTASIYQSTIIQDMHSVPYWAAKIIEDNLFKPTHKTYKKEVDEAIKFLLTQNKKVTKAEVCRLIGRRPKHLTIR